MAAVDIRDSVMLRQALVDERVSRIQQIEDAAIFVFDAADEQLGLAAERLPQVVVEIGKGPRIGVGGRQIPEIQPLPREVGDERLGTRVGQHPPRLLLEHHQIVQLSPDRGIQQLVVGNGAPQKRCQAGGKLRIADAIDTARQDAGGIALDPEQKLRARQNRAERCLNSCLEGVAACPAVLVKPEQPADFGGVRSPAKGAPRQR